MQSKRLNRILLALGMAAVGGLLLFGTGMLDPLLRSLANRNPQAGPTLVPMGGGGGLMAFESSRDGNPEIYVLSTDGSLKQNLTENPANDWGPAWSPDGGKVAFVSDRSGDVEVYLSSPDGSNLLQLTHEGVGGPLSWSPDGQYLVGVRTLWGDQSKNTLQYQLYLIHADGSGGAPLFPEQNPHASDFSPRWSPDGKRIAYLSTRYTTTGLYVADLATREQTTLSSGGAERVSGFDWSPDGTRLVYFVLINIQEGSPYSGELRGIDALGGEDVLLQPFAQLRSPNVDGPIWSPDGTRLVFAADLGDSLNGKLGPQLYHLWPDGSGLVPLVGLPSAETGLSWSPDSRWIAFVSDRSGGTNIFLMNTSEFYQDLQNRGLVQFTASGRDQNPQWQPKNLP